MKIPFYKPFVSGKETQFISEAISEGKLSGNGPFTKKCQQFFQDKYGFKKCLLTSSCTDALEMCALLADIQPGDEVILPSYSYVSTANAFALRGAKLIFADSKEEHPNIDVSKIEGLITSKTKLILVVHYGGVSCDMEPLMKIINQHQLLLVEDIAHAINALYKGKPLGTFGHFSTLSFHETKNITSGEGGMLCINDEKYSERAEVIWEKGTNRSQFEKGETEKYIWVDLGSSFLASEITAAALWSQVDQIEKVEKKRLSISNVYQKHIEVNDRQKDIGNGHLYFILCSSLQQKKNFIQFMDKNGVSVAFHYNCLHKSPFIGTSNLNLPNAQKFEERLVRLPLYFNLEISEVNKITNLVNQFFKETTR